MDVKEAYRVLQKASGIKVGDRVRVLRTNVDNELGSSLSGHTTADLDIGGREGIVQIVGVNGIWVKMSKTKRSYCMPFFVLEVIEPAKTIEIKYFCDGEDVTDSISAETKRSLTQ